MGGIYQHDSQIARVESKVGISTVSLNFFSLGIAFLAGLLSTLSPCVLPLLPLVVAPAASAHRYGVLALTSGLVISFVAIGLFVATLGISLGLDGETFRKGSAIILGLMGIVLLSEKLQQTFAIWTSGIGQTGNNLLLKVSPQGLTGQFLIGLLLGAIWSPCIGPTLGTASVLAAEGKQFFLAVLCLVIFGMGAAVPVLVVGSISRQSLGQWRQNMMMTGKIGKTALGVCTVMIATLILTGLDHTLEAWFIAISPQWLTDLTTRF